MERLTVRFRAFGLGLLALASGLLRAQGPAPSPAEQESFLEATRRVVSDYGRLLPDLICTQTIRRALIGKNAQEYRLDTLTIEVSFQQQEGERYTLKEVSGFPTANDFDHLNGVRSTGEFGTNMQRVFAAPSAVFVFEKWTTIRQRPAAIYSYRVGQSESRYELQFWDGKELQVARVGLRGEAAIDRETHGVLRIQYVADSVPPSFPMAGSSTVEYDYARIGDRRYLLPAKAVVRTTSARQDNRNDVTFHSYRKFASESSISFGDDPPPEP
jgi:hypothetical protein